MSSRARVVAASAGWPGHLFPVLALARELRSRGHEVLVETWERWRPLVEGMGMQLSPAAESFDFPGVLDASDADDSPGQTIADVVRELAPRLCEYGPDVVISDLFSLAPSLAAERAGLRRAAVIHHPYPVTEPGSPRFLLGLLPARTPLGRAAWRATEPLLGALDARHRQVRRSLDATRAELGLPRLGRLPVEISGGLTMVATFPQLEYPRRWPPHVHVTGPMVFEPPGPDVELPEGGNPLVVVASSTGQDRSHSLLRTALTALDGEHVRVLATTSRRGEAWRGPVPPNASVVDWLPYSRVMPHAAAVVCSGGAGTVAHALAAGAPVLVSPEGGDMAENGARLTWAGAGLMIPRRLAGPGALRRAVRRLLADPQFAVRARQLASWHERNDGAARGADLVERYAGLAR
jgi:UDP:flavonoid glycosyltransferase YjiC (YdhE family)